MSKSMEIIIQTINDAMPVLAVLAIAWAVFQLISMTMQPPAHVKRAEKLRTEVYSYKRFSLLE